jgi:hypothetical protein
VDGGPNANVIGTAWSNSTVVATGRKTSGVGGAPGDWEEDLASLLRLCRSAGGPGAVGWIREDTAIE